MTQSSNSNQSRPESSDSTQPDIAQPDIAQPDSTQPEHEVISPDAIDPEGPQSDPKPVPRGSVSEPAKVMRIGSMIRQLLEEVRMTELDERGRIRLREIYDTSVENLASALSPDLQEELYSLAVPFGDDELPSVSELRIAQAQLVGWLEGLFHGIQTTIFAQQAAAQLQLEQMKSSPPMPGINPESPRTGTYL